LPEAANPVFTICSLLPAGVKRVKKRAVALAVCCFLACSPARATTFVGVLWPLFGPLAAPGLVEFVAELQTMPDVEVITYLHPQWASLVDDINRQPADTHIVVIGYSLGANNAILVANNATRIDSVIALQPSIFTTSESLTGKVGRIVEIYNPNKLMTFGGMGSQKLEGPNIEYITNNDSHLGAPFNPEFRNLVRSEIARLNAPPPTIVQAKIPQASHPAASGKTAEARKLEAAKSERRQHQLQAKTAHADTVPGVGNSGSSTR
jgi:hypothetical protein